MAVKLTAKKARSKPKTVRLKMKVKKRAAGRRKSAVLSKHGGRMRQAGAGKKRRRVKLPGLGAAPAVPAAAEPPVEKKLERGVQLIGYSRRETGIGESCRLAADALETSGVPFGILPYTDHFIDRETDLSWVHKEIGEPRYGINVFHMNADSLLQAAGHYGPELFRGRYNIGYWHWELPDFPEEWCPSFQLVQEVWVPSLFVLDSVSRKSPVPVVRIPHGIRVQVPAGPNRAAFGLPDGRYLFLSMFDARSVVDRKNPQGAIEAFKRAFGPDDPAAGLVVKMNNPYPAAVELVKQLAEGYGNIYVLTGVVTRAEANALLAVTDSVVSLHRAEGYGLTLAEGMYLGKPAIGTNWSGNTDFMNGTNACPVDYRLIPVGTDYGPYRGYQTWADPDIEHAAWYMRRLVHDPLWGASISLKGQETIHTRFSPSAVGEMMRSRLGRLGQL